VVVLPTPFQPPLVLRWILTGTLAVHAVNPSLALTTPLATRCFFSFSVTLLECVLLTVKLVVLVAEPSAVVTLMGPVVAPAGTVAVILVALTTLNVAAVPLKVTAVAPVKFVPVIVTVVPTGPKVGVNEAIVGTPVLVTVNLWELQSVPPGVVTQIFPVVAPLGTVAVIWVDETTLNVLEETPLNVTLVAPVRFVPVMVTDVPTGPLVGVNEVIVGVAAVVVTVKLWELQSVPPGVVTQIFPVVAPVGTVAVIWVDEPPVKLVADVPPNVTAVAPVRFVPVIVTIVPTGPEVGVNEVIVGLVGGAAEDGGAMAIAATTKITARIAARARVVGTAAIRLMSPSLPRDSYTRATTACNRQVA
jgi:hypothetical protein